VNGGEAMVSAIFIDQRGVSVLHTPSTSPGWRDEIFGGGFSLRFSLPLQMQVVNEASGAPNLASHAQSGSVNPAKAPRLAASGMMTESLTAIVP